MTRNEFFTRLEAGLERVPPEEAAEAVRYYNEYFDDAGPERVQQVLEELGPPEKIAQQICAEHMVKDIVVEDAPQQPPKKKGLAAVWIAVLAVFASPIALPLAVAVAAVALAMVVVVLCILLVPFLVALGLLAGGLFGVVIGISVLGTHVPTGLYAIGQGLALSGIGLLGFLPLVWLAEAMFRGIGRLVSRAVTRRKKG